MFSKTLVTLFCLLSFLPGAAAQITGDEQIGFPNHGVFSGSNFDTVQVNNGNLHIEVPLWSVQGRGLAVATKMVYDNKAWNIRSHCVKSTGICTGTVGPSGNNHRILRVVTPINYTYSGGGATPPNGCGSTAGHVGYTLYEPDGSSHHFVPDPICGSSPSTLYADDGSGWLIQATSTAQFVKAVRKDGLDLSYSTSGNLVQTDANGNQLTVSSSGFTDTAGRTYAPDGSYYDSNGILRSLQITNTTVPFQTHLCPFDPYGDDVCNESSGTLTVPQVITLPNGMTYTFQYEQNQYGEPNLVTLPTGGQISWTWNPPQGAAGRWVASRTETGNGSSATWSYAYTYSRTNPTTNLNHIVTATVTDPAGNDTSSTFNCGVTFAPGGVFAIPGICPEATRQSFQGSAQSGTLVQTATAGSLVCPKYFGTTTWNQSNLVSKVEIDYDSFVTPTNNTITWCNVKERREYAFGVGAPGALVRKTHYNYLHLDAGNAVTYRNLNIADKPISNVIYDSTGTNIVAQTNYTYDGVAIARNTSSTPAPNHDYTNYPSTYNTRGNLTQVSRGLKVGSTWTWLNTNSTYDDLGNVLTSQDPALHTTNFDYTDSWSDSNCTLGTNTFAYLTKTTDALGHRTQQKYYRCTGRVGSTQDENDIVNNRAGTTSTYDLMNRPVTVSYPDGGQTTNGYNDVAPISVMQTKLMTTSVSLQRTTVSDGLGRVKQTQLKDPDCASGTGLVKVDHAYGFTTGAGKYVQGSTPYCNSPDATYGLMATTKLDALGRVTSVVQTDRSTITTTYSGTTAGLTSTVTDEAGKKRTSQTDALGRLTAVWEDPSGLNYETDYAYDTLDNLTSVTQKGGATSGSWRTRTFTNDSLSRLKCAANPEVAPASCPTTDTGAYTPGTIGYTYDADGNVLTKIAPKPNQTASATVTTSYVYDAVNRLTQESYNDGTTPTISYVYDEVNPWGGNYPYNYIGRLTETDVRDASGNVLASSYFHYDPLGRVILKAQCTPSSCAPSAPSFAFHTSYSYDLLGDMTSVGTLESGITFGYAYDGAGRPTQITSSVPDSQHPGTLLAVDPTMGYYPNGALRKATYGNGLTYASVYNKRLQPCRFNLNSSGTSLGTCSDAIPSGNVQDFNYSFNLGTADNGNVASMLGTGAQAYNRTYSYDSLNRLQTMADSASGQACRGLQWNYDAWGNRTDQTLTSGTCFAFHTTANTQNRLVGYQYDAAGNLTSDGSHSYAYDAENRIIQVDAGNTAKYTYDAEGNRVQKTAGTAITQYVYDTSGHVLHDVNGTGGFNAHYIYLGGSLLALYQNSTTYFVHRDHLGSTRLLTRVDKSIYDSIDYLPYGEQIAGGTGTTSHKFTGKERDSESGLDYFGARHYSSGLGRFMVPDWAAKPISVPYANFGDPQSLNLYSYVRNHPISQTDQDGHTCIDPVSCGLEFAGIGTLIEPGGGTAVGAIVGGIVGGAILYYGGKAVVDQIHRSDDNANKNAPPPPASSQSKSQGAQSTPADPNQGKSGKEGAQDKKLTKSEVKALEKNTGETAEDIKSDTMQSEKASKFDLYKNSDGDIVAKPKGSSGAGEQTGYTTEDLKTKPD